MRCGIPSRHAQDARAGVTFIELLAALVLAVLMAGGVMAALHLEGRTLPEVVGRDVVQTGLSSMQQFVADTLQNALDVRSWDASQVVCDTVDGGTVAIRLISAGVSGGQPVTQLQVTTTPAGGAAPPVVRTWALPAMTLAGTTFSVQGSLVTIHWHAVSIGSSVTSAAADWDATYAIGGGN
ncbi:hypothetical protein [Alicyclobacillus sp.]|uniref:hypothetical protein n=1 Tax=Alicyclobacillus sp. TaxID=61169 RepID=UPI0025BFDEA3|nr:hypothetical protein [Alicyclobacillus sp.]MCL6516149.1 hypothetical protein [Alicyclobacillus sp.]